MNSPLKQNKKEVLAKWHENMTLFQNCMSVPAKR